MHIFDHIAEDLRQVQQLLKKNFCFRGGHLNTFMPMNFNHLDMNLRPGIIITAGRMFGPVTEQLVALAAVLQFIFMASRVHFEVEEYTSGKERSMDIRTGFQYPVLVGDYLYGKFFTTLCEFGIVRYLKELAELICHINKSGIQALRDSGSEHTDRQSYLDVIRGETARLFASGAYLGADLAGACEADKNNLYHFGLNLGMAYGLLEKGTSSSQVKKYISTAEANLLQLPEGIEKQCFRELLTFLFRNNIIQRMVG